MFAGAIFHNIILLAITILGFTTVISVHEFGHFLFCKLFGVKVPTFSIGMGKALFKKNLWGTDFTISSLPIGGYVEISTHDDIDPAMAPSDSFTSKPYWQKFLIMFGGIMFNIIGAYIVYTAIFCFSGMPTNKVEQLTVTEVLASSPAKNVLFEKDVVIGVDGQTFDSHQKLSLDDFYKKIRQNKGQSLDLMVKKGDGVESLQIPIPQTDDSFGILKVRFDHKVKYMPGETLSLFAALAQSGSLVWQQIRNIGTGVASMVQRRSIQGAAGPVMILSESFKMAKNGMVYFLMFLCFISISLAITNVLPFGMLDGGQIATVTIETIVGKPLPLLKTIVFLLSAVALGGLTLLLTYREILQLIGK